ncbi:hypothetical protein [Paenibacillus amylolyticus]|uniref:hypothetical protein n=1 Tax=Paenibacillus amylolyticus TaxID=1451 RepID=UPI00096C945E|nr:hypothetical protein [Paenibacillus amylolyticus]OMF45414.1 hypothetical protein BK136_09950 [Paenibacillus amylolyticus]
MEISVLILYILSLSGVVGLEIYFYYRFIKVLSLPFKEFEPQVEFTSVETLYEAYKKLPKGKFKHVKLRVRAWNKPEIIPQTVDSFMKIIVTLLLTTTGVVISILIANLNFANSNKEINANQRSDWYDNIRSILEGLVKGISSYQNLMYIALFLFILSFVHISISYLKSSLYKKHVVVLDEIEKEYNTDQKLKK